MSQFTDLLTDLRQIAIDQGWHPSKDANDFDTTQGKRVHKMFYMDGRVSTTLSASQYTDFDWRIVFTMAWQLSPSRANEEFRKFEMLEAIAELGIAWVSDAGCPWGDVMEMATATPIWDPTIDAFRAEVTLRILEQRAWTRTN